MQWAVTLYDADLYNVNKQYFGYEPSGREFESLQARHTKSTRDSGFFYVWWG